MADDRRLADFIEWSRERGIRFDDVEIRSAGEGAGNGVFARDSQRANKNVIELPAGELLTAGRVVERERYRRMVEEKGVRPTAFEMLVLFFYLEREEEGSEWTPYLRMLPSSFDTPVAAGLPLRDDDLPLSVRRFWLPPLLPAPVDDDRLLWAWHVVNTRCIFVENPPHPLIDTSTVEDTIAVIPFVDMLNHSSDASCVAELDKRNGKYVVRLNKAVPEGSEVHVCYGPHDNGRLWVEYGFRLTDNPFTKVFLPTDLLLALAKKSGLSIDIHHQTAVEDAALSSTLYMSDEGPSWAFRTNVRILHMEHRDIGKWRDIVYSEGKRRRTGTGEKPRRRTGDAEEESSDDEEPPMDEKTRERLTNEGKTMDRILGELLKALQGRSMQVSEPARFLWKEQCSLIETAKRTILAEIEQLQVKEEEEEE
ncbi:set-29 [Pristionchus pacificus]|uniref:Set-29 n=1 Tax=Pristionchus pacificus TaxID=54126 RepID=A0A2A6BT60_PRIPA|nr:set-29 [Pristionchus pacificus]|eukprot:PDM69075.1 set-29 [Pristionchus pacificus]